MQQAGLLGKEDRGISMCLRKCSK